jgi:excisionase family DNA binding protein|tara:strand:- start:382 stop:546 length:165 start_codon:yes stop_codon:yes gene_type:complete
MKQKLYTTQQMASILGVHPRTIRVWVKDGKLKEIKLGYRTRRYYLDKAISLDNT